MKKLGGGSTYNYSWFRYSQIKDIENFNARVKEIQSFNKYSMNDLTYFLETNRILKNFLYLVSVFMNPQSEILQRMKEARYLYRLNKYKPIYLII